MEGFILNQTTYKQNNQMIIYQEQQPIYEIRFEQTFKHLYKGFNSLNSRTKKICIVTDSTVGSFYLSELMDELKDYAKELISFTFPAGEESKNLSTVTALYERLIKEQFDRNDILVALGGGVVGDLTGFTAATYLRGIDFVQIPTSLLAMVDSSIGGKTGVDFNAYKNMVGAFHQPKFVYMNLTCLSTLTKRQFQSGFGEVIKYGLLNDALFYQWLRENREALLHGDGMKLQEAVYRSCVSKKEIVEEDPTEKGRRALLNLGHTIGHAIEKLKEFSLLHGECVSIGLVAAAYLSVQKGLLTEVELEDLKQLLESYGLPVRTSGIDPEDVLKATKNDKKMSSGKIKFIILDKIGNALIDDSITEEEMLEAIKFVIE